jgi:hypothetical protein
MAKFSASTTAARREFRRNETRNRVDAVGHFATVLRGSKIVSHLRDFDTVVGLVATIERDSARDSGYWKNMRKIGTDYGVSTSAHADVGPEILVRLPLPVEKILAEALGAAGIRRDRTLRTYAEFRGAGTMARWVERVADHGGVVMEIPSPPKAPAALAAIPGSHCLEAAAPQESTVLPVVQSEAPAAPQEQEGSPASRESEASPVAQESVVSPVGREGEASTAPQESEIPPVTSTTNGATPNSVMSEEGRPPPTRYPGEDFRPTSAMLRGPRRPGPPPTPSNWAMTTK